MSTSRRTAMAGTMPMERSHGVRRDNDDGGRDLRFAMILAAGIGLLLLLWLLGELGSFMAAQQAMFEAMAAMADVCRI